MGPMTRAMLVFLLIAIIVAFAVGVLVVRMSPRLGKNTGNLIVRGLGDVSADVWGRLSDMTIFFGHQSVGNNILDGVRDLAAAYDSVNLEIAAVTKTASIEEAVWAHAAVGRNREPLSKIAAFKEYMENGLGEKVDIAFLKFCYVDIRSDTDPNAILDAYCETMETLKSRFPDVVFMHITVPLRAAPRTAKSRLKASFKRILGHSTVLDDNRVRARYNELLRERYRGKDPLFDLARYEALGPDGLEHFGLWKGQQIPILVESYTDDGGHLNAVGRRHVAEQLLIELSELAQTVK